MVGGENAPAAAKISITCAAAMAGWRGDKGVAGSNLKAWRHQAGIGVM